MNSTTLGHHASAQELYAAAGTDFSNLSWLETQWAAWYIWIGNPIIATGLMSFIMHEVVYFGRCIPWIIIDAMPYFNRWKLQPGKVPSAKSNGNAPNSCSFPTLPSNSPKSGSSTPWQKHAACRPGKSRSHRGKPSPPKSHSSSSLKTPFTISPTKPPLWTPVQAHHKIHHKYSAPFGLAAEYAHPAEVLILERARSADRCCTAGSPKTCTFSPYFPWSLNRIIPFWSGADHHDFHHMAFVNNYSTSFRWLDYMFGTDDKYRAYKARLASASAKDRAELEKKLLEETEQEGIVAANEAEKKSAFGRKGKRD
ncbi:sterol oxidase [Rhizoctonia solani]|uniref:Sterol oxidase n=1 Tax=Rhizoctonia solani TaxID=456999 RepID=A0A8H7IA42_9AGAM|nr:sterol oxidase [Rhizoctonia solani]